MRSYLICLPILTLCIACGGGSKFKGGSAVQKGQAKPEQVKHQDAKQGQPAPMPEAETTEESTSDFPPNSTIDVEVNKKTGARDFDIKVENSSQVDMLWVIDNSSSMGEEAEQVQANMEKFMKSLVGRADVRVSVISTSRGSTGVRLSREATNAGHMQFDNEVASQNLLTLASSALCPESETSFPLEKDLERITKDQVNGNTLLNSPYKICGHTEDRMNYLRREPQIQPLRGKFLSRLRPGAAKVLVFVTDDDSMGVVGKDNFFPYAKLSAQNTRVFAFRGLADREGCDIARRGAAFEKLAGDTKGEVFDICEVDWSANFSKLSENVIRIAQNRFKLDGKPGLIITKVSLDGQVLAPGAYSYMDGVIQIADEALLAKSKTLHVEYEHN